jgi:tetratricopeptide (TPR) repeat protein
MRFLVNELRREDLELQIADLRGRLVRAEPGSDEATVLILGLADLLSERFRRGAPDPDHLSARQDIDEVVSRLDTLLDHLGLGSPDYAEAIWRVGFARYDRWTEYGDPADQDAAIQQLTEALGAVTPSGPPGPEIHAALAELHEQRAYDREQGESRGAELDLAIAQARAGLTALSPPVGLRLVLGLALWERSVTDQQLAHRGLDGYVDAARVHRDESIAVLERTLGEIADRDYAWAAASIALGCARFSRFSDSWPGAQPEDPADLDAAISLLPDALDMSPDPRALHYLILAFAARLDRSHQPDDRDQLISWGRFLLDGEQHPTADQNFVREMISSALVERAEAAAPTRDADLDEAINQLETALNLTPSGDAERVPLLKDLTRALWLSLNGDESRFADVDKMTAAADEAWALLPPDDSDRALIGMYVAFGIDSRLRRPGEPLLVPPIDHAIDVLSDIEPLLADEPSVHLQVIILLGHFLVSRGQITGDISDIKNAEPWILRAASHINLDDPHGREFAQVLGIAMTVLANLGMNTEHVDRAISLLEKIVDQPSPDPVAGAMTRGALGVLLAQRASFLGDRNDLDQGISAMTTSYENAPPGHAYRAAVGANLAGALMTRFLECGQAEDLDATRFYLDTASALTGEAGDEVRALMADVSVSIVANRGMLRAIEGLRGDAAALDDAVAGLEAALAMVPGAHPHRGRIRCDLGFVLALRALRGRAGATDLAQAARHATAATEELADGHLMYPLALLRAGGALTGAAVAAGDRQLIRDAIGYTAHALGEVDPRYGNRFRLVVLLGAATVALHGLTGDPADLDHAIGWLEKARLDLDKTPSHPQVAYCLINLARAYHTRGDAWPSVETGLAALRARARALLLQSGTDRSLHFARIAVAEAVEVASWCLADGRAESAIEALELGRGLILHSATAVSALPELLTVMGRPDLAAAWRESVTTEREGPWDRRDRGQEYLALLRAGTSSLDVPDDIRAKVFAALAGSTAEQRLLAPPTVTEIGGALEETGADVLAYLVQAAGGTHGHAVLVRAADRRSDRPAVSEIVPLPLLRGDVLDAYSQAYMAVAMDQAGHANDLEAVRVIGDWRRALEDLCEWAWPAAILPILSKLHSWGIQEPPRLVLIAGGLLSLVPWHAARSGSRESGRVRYALHDAVFSYAASARQLADAAHRPSLALSGNPVILGDPTNSLPSAILEAEGIYDRCYPSGRYFGFTSAGWQGTAAGEGTPGQVLRELPRRDQPGASILHLGCHGRAIGSAPGQSHLLLANKQKLRVDAILRQAKDRPLNAPGGLVSLAACSSDLAAAEYDEALTPATAFLAAGAVTVIGARWEIPDGATSLLMFMFHLYMTRDGNSPRDALRLAQTWMVNSNREIPEEMPRELAKLVYDRKLRDITAWAGFVHQGR